MPHFLALLLLVLFASPARATTVYFLVTEFPGAEVHHDSYVLPLSDPGAIAHARDLIAQGPSLGSTIAVAVIASGSDGVNRNWIAAGAPEWSWHVAGFAGFAEYTIELIDGWPSYLESDVAGWIANTGGVIGFWNYTVTRELTNIPEPSAAALSGLGLALLALRRHQRSLRSRD